jgi:predicted molibdopterin-dependent oxidoreductase YjgC
MLRQDGLRTVTVIIEDQQTDVHEGLSVAAVLLVHGLDYTRTTAVTETPRAPYCMMGVCFDCLVEIDGIPNIQACMTIVRNGMNIRRQLGKRTLSE